MVAFAKAFSNTLTNVSKCYLVCCGIKLTLSLAWPIFTTGNSIPFTCTPNLHLKITHVHHKSWNQTADDLISNIQGNNCAWITENLSSVLLKFSSQVVIVFHNLRSQLSSHLWSENSQVSQRCCCLNWIYCVCKHVSSGEIFEIFNDFRIFTTHKPNVCT